jgi:DNA-binding Lrp family transcriptional regulator
MEEALILITLSYSYPAELLDKIKTIPEIAEANLIYGPYDMFVLIKTKTKLELRDMIIKLRENEGIKSTLTCNVVPGSSYREF